MNKKNLIIIIILLVIFGYLIFKNQKRSWTLSLYSYGITIMRLEHKSLESCMSAGDSYIADQSVDRFDCGLNCKSSIDLSTGIHCEQICNVDGCR